MTKTIDTLVEDIYSLFGSGIEFDQEIAKFFGDAMAKTVSSRVPSVKTDGNLRMSNVGSACLRKLWYTCNLPHTEAEEMPKSTLMKFLYGDIIEEVVLYLAAEAGHRVEGMQDELEINGVKGHRDAVIDGVLVDVKSASTYSFKKFTSHLTQDQDAFGYIPQLQQYLYASQDDPLVTDKDRAAFLVVDKTLGHICLDVHGKDGVDYGRYVNQTKTAVASDNVPSRGYPTEEDGKSGNEKLGVNCSYCEWKHKCYPGLRTFLYSGGPRFLTKVARVPDVHEVT